MQTNFKHSGLSNLKVMTCAVHDVAISHLWLLTTSVETKVRYAVNVKYTLDFENLVQRKECRLILLI